MSTKPPRRPRRRVKVRRRQSRYTLVAAALVYDPELSDRAFRLYAALCLLSNEAGELTRGAEDIAKAMGGSSDRSRREAQRELVALGYLTVEARTGPAGRRGWSEYTVYDELDVKDVLTSSDSPSSPGNIAAPSPGDIAGVTGAPAKSPPLTPAEMPGGSPGEITGGTPAESPPLAPAESPPPVYLDGEVTRARLGDLPSHCQHGFELKRTSLGLSVCPICRRAELRRQQQKATGS